MIRYKYLLFTFCVCFINSLYAQELHTLPPKVSYKNFGFDKPVKSSKENMYEVENGKPVLMTTRIYKFDEAGNILEDENHMFVGADEYITTYQYKYKSGSLDSLIEVSTNKTPTNTKTFIRAISNFTFNEDSRVLIEKSRAVGGSSGMTYYYYSGDNVTKKIDRVKEPGNSHETTTYFSYENNQLVEASDVTEMGTPQDDSRTYYNNGELIAIYYLESKEIQVYGADGTNQIVQLKESDKDFMKNYRLLLKDPKVNAIQEIAKTHSVSEPTFVRNNDAKDKTGNWIKRLPINSWGQVRATFREIHYANGTKSGDTKYDEAFVKQIQKK